MFDFNKAVDKHKKLIIDTQNYIWANPETGYKEFKTSKYMEDVFESFGYEIKKAEGITGFYTELDTGREGPTLLILGELDSTDPYTYCGALRSLIRMIKSDFPESKIIISASMRKKKDPEKRTDDLKHLDFHNAFMAVSRAEGIEPINFYDDPELDPFNPESMPDGLHMSEKACKHMADVFAEYIRNL